MASATYIDPVTGERVPCQVVKFKGGRVEVKIKTWALVVPMSRVEVYAA